MKISISSGEQTTSKAIFAGPCALTGVQIISDGTNDPKVILHDNATAASGTVKGEIACDASTELMKHFNFANVEFVNGIYTTISGTGASYIIEYRPL